MERIHSILIGEIKTAGLLDNPFVNSYDIKPDSAVDFIKRYGPFSYPAANRAGLESQVLGNLPDVQIALLYHLTPLLPTLNIICGDKIPKVLF